jgi:hypothetical protein
MRDRFEGSGRLWGGWTVPARGGGGLPALALGPAWSRPGLDVVSARYPLRVETHVLRLVAKLLPGVITTTPHARAYALHGLVWSEAARRGLDFDAACDLLRRCEVVVAGVSLRHQHQVELGAPHGGDVVQKAMGHDQPLAVAELSATGRYSQSKSGFGGVYAGSEIALGIIDAGRPPTPGPRLDEERVRAALAGVFELAEQDEVPVADLRAAGELCICMAPSAPDGPWLQRLFLQPDLGSEAGSEAGRFQAGDAARRATAQLLGAVVAPGVEGSLVAQFRRAIGTGDFIHTNPVAAALSITPAWRGAVLRNYSVGAWRRAWSWLVEELGEPMTAAELGERFADALPDIAVGDVMAELPATMDYGVLAPVEEELRTAQPRPDPWTEVRLLAAGARRLDDLEDLDDRALAAFAGLPSEDDLGPRWVARQLEANARVPLRRFAESLVDRLVRRSQRVAYSKMTLQANGRPKLPTRLRERDGLLIRGSLEGWADVSFRVDTLASVLLGLGSVSRVDGRWSLTPVGADLLA